MALAGFRAEALPGNSHRSRKSKEPHIEAEAAAEAEAPTPTVDVFTPSQNSTEMTNP